MKNEMTGIIAALEKLVGPLSLFLISRSEDSPASMLTLVVSGAGLDKLSVSEASKLIIDCVKKVASPQLQRSIGRVNVRLTSDSLVQAITTMIDLPAGPVNMQNTSFDGVFIPDATVYKAVPHDRGNIVI